MSDRYRDWTGKEPFKDTETYVALKVSIYCVCFFFIVGSRSWCVSIVRLDFIFYERITLFSQIFMGGVLTVLVLGALWRTLQIILNRRDRGSYVAIPSNYVDSP